MFSKGCLPNVDRCLVMFSKHHVIDNVLSMVYISADHVVHKDALVLRQTARHIYV